MLLLTISIPLQTVSQADKCQFEFKIDTKDIFLMYKFTIFDMIVKEHGSKESQLQTLENIV